MTISYLNDAKRKIKTRSPAFLITVGIILLISSVIVFWNGSIDYQIQNKQTEWIVTNATISHVETKVEGARGSNYGHTSTYFDIYYEYVVDDQTYTGIIEEQNQRRNIGEPLKIKYNPNIPQESTCILEPSKSFITSGTVCALLAISLISFSIYLAKKYPV